MYNDENEKSRSGYKLYTVKSLDMQRSWVYLEGLVVRLDSPGYQLTLISGRKS